MFWRVLKGCQDKGFKGISYCKKNNDENHQSGFLVFDKLLYLLSNESNNFLLSNLNLGTANNLNKVHVGISTYTETSSEPVRFSGQDISLNSKWLNSSPALSMLGDLGLVIFSQPNSSHELVMEK